MIREASDPRHFPGVSVVNGVDIFLIALHSRLNLSLN